MRPAARQTGLDPRAARAAGRKDDMLSRSSSHPGDAEPADARAAPPAPHRTASPLLQHERLHHLPRSRRGRRTRRVPHLRPAAQPCAAQLRADRSSHALSAHHPSMTGADDHAAAGRFDASLTARGLTIRLQTRGRSSGQPRLVTIGFVERPDGSCSSPRAARRRTGLATWRSTRTASSSGRGDSFPASPSPWPEPTRTRPSAASSSATARQPSGSGAGHRSVSCPWPGTDGDPARASGHAQRPPPDPVTGQRLH